MAWKNAGWLDVVVMWDIARVTLFLFVLLRHANLQSRLGLGRVVGS